jgi:hypothetical protein
MRISMLLPVVLSFLAGVVGANGIPHFVSGIIGKEYPNLTGNSPVHNVIGGWAALVIACLLAYWADPGQHLGPAFAAGALGVLGMALFHAYGGAFWVNARSGRSNPARQTAKRPEASMPADG